MVRAPYPRHIEKAPIYLSPLHFVVQIADRVTRNGPARSGPSFGT
jgi:hypothetical protein